MRYLLVAILIISGVFVDAHNLRAAMSSADYYIYADDFNLGGGLSSGGDYSLQDTIDSPADIVSGGSYSLRAGYQFQTRGTISISISSSSLNLGSLDSTGASSTVTTTVTVTTDSDTGYVLSVSDVSGTSLTAVTDGTVDGDGSSEEYGLGLAGSERAFADDRAVASNLTVASMGEPATNSATVLTFKAVRGSASTHASYSQSITISAAANF